MTVPATVTINEQQWSVSLATSLSDLEQGLSGIASIPVLTGMLFDMGGEHATIDINMQEMLFNLDVLFADENGVITEIMLDCEPGTDFSSSVSARYFMEVNAGELVGVSVGDQITVDVEEVIDYSLINDLMMVSIVAVIMVMGVRWAS